MCKRMLDQPTSLERVLFRFAGGPPPADSLQTGHATLNCWVLLSRSGGGEFCERLNKPLDVGTIVVRGKRDPNTVAAGGTYDLLLLEFLYRLHRAFAAVSEGNNVWTRSDAVYSPKGCPTMFTRTLNQHGSEPPSVSFNLIVTQ